MATTTTDFNIRPEDGWTLVATAPAYCLIKPAQVHPWWVAVSASLPASTLEGLSFGRDPNLHREQFELPVSTTENVYIRVKSPVAREPSTQKASFSAVVKV